MKQDKDIEKKFFDSHAENEEYYDAFLPITNKLIVDRFEKHCRPAAGDLVADIGCGSGVFTDIMCERGYQAFGIDLSIGMLNSGRTRFSRVPFIAADAEALPFADNSLDGVMLSAIVHHFPDPVLCAQETFRVLKKGGRFFAFDPNRLNPAMYIYRDHTSPLYSRIGVTENERPVMPHTIAQLFRDVGFHVETNYLSKLKFRYVASSSVRWLLPAYNLIDDIIFRPPFLKWFRPFVLTSGIKK